MNLSNPSLFGQFVREIMVFLMNACACLFSFKLVKHCGQRFLILTRQASVGHREQDVVFLLNVSAKKRDIRRKIACERFSRRSIVAAGYPCLLSNFTNFQVFV
jgi:hypothetical protein